MNKLTIMGVLGLLLMSYGCSTTNSGGKYYSKKSAENRVCPGNEMNFDRKLAAEKRLQIALHKVSRGMMVKAKENLECALKYAPREPIVHRVFAYYFEQVGEPDTAKTAYRYALKLSSRDPETLNQYGTFMCKQGEYEKAIDLFLKAIDIPSYAEVAATYENAGLCSLDAGNLERAEKFFRKALGYDKNSTKSLLEMAELMHLQSHHQMAQQYLARYSKNAKYSARSLWLAMRVEQKLGNKDKLGTFAIKLEQLFPDSEETASYLEKKKQWQR